MGTGELDERRPVAERERALAYSAEFRLGSLERVSRGRQMHRYTGLGVVFGGIVLVAGLPTLIGIDAGPYTGVTKAVVSAVVGALLVGCVWLLAEGRSRTRLTSRLYRYSDGLAQLVGDEPEPRVARWADVKDFTVDYYESDEVMPRFNGFSLTTSTGTRLPGLSGPVHRRELRDLVAEAERQLAPRLVPALTEAYESGGTVSFGRVLVSQPGIRLSAWYPPGELVPWSQVKSVHMTYINSKYGDYVHEIVVGRKGGETEEIRVSGLPNGIFLPALLHHAAGQHGVMVTGYHGDGGGIPASNAARRGPFQVPVSRLPSTTPPLRLPPGGWLISQAGRGPDPTWRRPATFWCPVPAAAGRGRGTRCRGLGRRTAGRTRGPWPGRG